MLRADSVEEPVNPRWNLGCDFDKWCEEHDLYPSSEEDERLICRAIRQERKTSKELKELRLRIKDPLKYLEKQRKHEERRVRK